MFLLCLGSSLCLRIYFKSWVFMCFLNNIQTFFILVHFLSSWFRTVSFSSNNTFFVNLHNLDSDEGYWVDRGEEQHVRLTHLLARAFTFSFMCLESNFIQSCFKCIHGQNLPCKIWMQHYIGRFKSEFLKFSLNFLFCLDPTAYSCLFKNCAK